jgi:hypothetical protein
VTKRLGLPQLFVNINIVSLKSFVIKIYMMQNACSWLTISAAWRHRAANDGPIYFINCFANCQVIEVAKQELYIGPF